MEHKVALNFDDGVTQFITVSDKGILLDAAMRQGVTLPVDCREGVCATCMGTCESGRYEHDYVDEDALSEEDLAQGGVLACQMRVKSDCTVKFNFASHIAGSKGAAEVHGTVSKVSVLSETAALLNIDAGEHSQQIDFLPGQYAHVNVPNTDAWRSYSFSRQSNSDNQLQFLIRLLPEGQMSDYLTQRAKPGDNITMKLPLGAFYLREHTRPLIMIAGGTGLAPFLSMLEHLLSNGELAHPVTLFYGVTRFVDLCETERLAELAAQSDQIQVHSIIMEASPSWNGSLGVVTDLLQGSHFNGGDVDTYLCGPPPMVDAVKQWLADNDMAKCPLYFEKFSAS